MTTINNKFFATKLINEKNYQITKMPALKALGMARTLAKLVLPLLGGAIDGIRDDGLMGTPKTFTDLATVLCTQLDGFDLDTTITTLLKDCMCDGKQITNVDDHFQGEIGELLSVIEFALRENFSSFFTGNDMTVRLKKALATLGIDFTNELGQQ